MIGDRAGNGRNIGSLAQALVHPRQLRGLVRKLGICSPVLEGLTEKKPSNLLLGYC